MIITCSQCQTRFKVGDDKLASGPIRVRCSKCNHVFMASSTGGVAPPASASQPPSGTLPPTMLSTLPPQPGFVPSSPTPRPAVGPITGMFQAFGDAPAASGFGSPSNRSGIFKAPASDFRPPTQDPFAGLAPPQAAPPPQAPPSFPPPSMAPSTRPPPGFSPPSFPPPSFPPPSFPPPSFPPQTLAPPPMPPRSMSPVPSMPPRTMSPVPPMPPRTMSPLAQPLSPVADPFGAAPDPFAGVGPPSTSDPFANGSPVADPFAGLPTAAATPHAKDPFGLGSPSPASAFAPPPPPAPSPFGAAPFSFDADPSARTEGHSSADLFGAGASLATDPFGHGAAPQNAGAGAPPVDDPFGNLDLGASSVESMTPTGPPSPPPEETDPFADLDVGGDASTSAASMDDPFDRPPPPPPRPPPPAAEPKASVAHTAPASSSMVPQAAPADPAKLRRLETTQRVRAIAWAAVQLLIFVAFLAVAVVLGRGGTLEDLLRGDVGAALGGPRVEGNLAIEHPRVKKRSLPSGMDVVIVSGQVHNTTQSPVPGARVEVRLGKQGPVSGWAWSTLDGVDLAAVADAASLAALAERTPSSASLAPGERAPFVVVLPAAEEGLAASFSVQAAPPPATAASPAPAAAPAAP